MSAVEDPEDGIVVSKPTVRRLVLEHFAHHERFCSAPVGLQDETMRWLARYRATLSSALLIERLADPETFAAAAAIVGKRQRREAEVLVRETLELYAEDSAMGIAAIGALVRMEATQKPLPQEFATNPELLPATLAYWEAHAGSRRTDTTPAVIALSLDSGRLDAARAGRRPLRRQSTEERPLP